MSRPPNVAEMAGQLQTCRWCSMVHTGKCPLVKRISYYADGVSVREVEFFSPQEMNPAVVTRSGFSRSVASSPWSEIDPTVTPGPGPGGTY